MKSFIIKKDFVISIFNDYITIKKDTNPLNTKSYFYNDILRFEIKGESNSLIHSILQLIFEVYTENENILIIETKDKKDTLFLKGCDMQLLTKLVDQINNYIKSKKQTQIP